MNQCNFIGRLTKDVEFSVSQSGVEMAKGTIAVNRPFKDQNGEYQADFIKFIAFKKTAEAMRNYTNKGDQIGLNGRWQTRNYENDQGQRVYMNELVVENMTLISGNKSQDGQGGGQGGYNRQPGPNTPRQPNNSYTNAYGSQGGYNNQATTQNRQAEPNPFQNDGGPVDISDDDLPF